MRLSGSPLGIVMGVGAYAIWGLLPLFLKALRPLPAIDILSHRIMWSLLLLAVVVVVMRRGAILKLVLRQPRLMAALFASAALIGGNWLLYIFAVNSGHVLDASLGYYINPLLNVLLGVIVLRERLGRAEIGAIALAAAGVLTLAIAQRGIPVMALGLALSFGLYGLVRKMTPVGPLEGLMIETGLLAPAAIGWLLLHDGPLSMTGGPPLWLLALGGLITTVPLLLFAGAAQRIRYSELGLLQYLSPTVQLLLAVAVFDEPLLPIHMVTFALIWSGLAVYAVATWHRGRITPALPE